MARRVASGPQWLHVSTSTDVTPSATSFFSHAVRGRTGAKTVTRYLGPGFKRELYEFDDGSKEALFEGSDGEGPPWKWVQV